VAAGGAGAAAHRIGVLLGFEATDSDADRLLAALKKGLQELGWVEGRNIVFDCRWPASGRATENTLRATLGERSAQKFSARARSL
jgi:hypothetical protein